jgi:hypothetical protein
MYTCELCGKGFGDKNEILELNPTEMHNLVLKVMSIKDKVTPFEPGVKVLSTDDPEYLIHVFLPKKFVFASNQGVCCETCYKLVTEYVTKQKQTDQLASSADKARSSVDKPQMIENTQRLQSQDAIRRFCRFQKKDVELVETPVYLACKDGLPLVGSNCGNHSCCYHNVMLMATLLTVEQKHMPKPSKSEVHEIALRHLKAIDHTEEISTH